MKAIDMLTLFSPGSTASATPPPQGNDDESARNEPRTKSAGV
ncbi:Hypothetical protein ABZS17H1_00139 [Kosakonia cowanii]